MHAHQARCLYQSLLAARLGRLGRAAQEAIASARDGDITWLRDQLQWFEAMVTAMWTVQLSAASESGSGRR